jgi:hypothetical protein
MIASSCRMPVRVGSLWPRSDRSGPHGQRPAGRHSWVDWDVCFLGRGYRPSRGRRSLQRDVCHHQAPVHQVGLESCTRVRHQLVHKLWQGTVRPQQGTVRPQQGTGSPRQGTGSPRRGTGSPRRGTGSPRQGTVRRGKAQFAAARHSSPRRGTGSPRQGTVRHSKAQVPKQAHFRLQGWARHRRADRRACAPDVGAAERAA